MRIKLLEVLAAGSLQVLVNMNPIIKKTNRYHKNIYITSKSSPTLENPELRDPRGPPNPPPKKSKTSSKLPKPPAPPPGKPPGKPPGNPPAPWGEPPLNPAWPNSSYWAFFCSSDRISYASWICTNFSRAAGSLFVSGWYCLASYRKYGFPKL